MAHYLLRQNGYKVFYVGQSVPLDSLKQIHNTIKPDNVLLFFISSKNNEHPAQYLEELIKLWPKSMIFFSGNPDIIKSVNSTPNLIYLQDFNSLGSHLSNSKAIV